MAKHDLDDDSGIRDMERALEIALDIDSPVASPILNNLAVYAVIEGDLKRMEELYAEGLRLAERFGDAQSARFIRANLTWTDLMRGRWDPALEDANAFIAECEAGSPLALEQNVRLVRATIRGARGDSEGALADQERAVVLARENTDPIQLVGVLAHGAAAHAERRDLEAARRDVAEMIGLLRSHGIHGAVSGLTSVAAELGLRDELRDAVEHAPGPRAERWRTVILRALDGDVRGAADDLAAMGAPTLEAELRRQAGRQLLESGLHEEGEIELRKALEFYDSVRATYRVREIEALLATTAYSDSA
jgi:tetratricopeptide (TPR) repeat protein